MRNSVGNGAYITFAFIIQNKTKRKCVDYVISTDIPCEQRGVETIGITNISNRLGHAPSIDAHVRRAMYYMWLFN